jgi:hypothetical protein
MSEMIERPYADSELAKFLSKRIDELAATKSQRLIAQQAGFKTPGIISMIKTGDAKLPLDRVIGLAKALETDPAHLMRMAIKLYFTNDDKETTQLFDAMFMSANEKAIITLIREISGASDPGLNDQRRSAITKAFS